VFGLDFAEVARTLDRNEAACRQLAARARTHIEAGRPRFTPSPEEGRRLAAAFQVAAASADKKALVRLLADDAVLCTLERLGFRQRGVRVDELQNHWGLLGTDTACYGE
jgi:hypothetical protein